MAIIIKDSDTLNKQTIEYLANYTASSNTSKGTLVQAVVYAVNAALGESYEILTSSVAQAYLSSATGNNLDLMGVVLNIKRGGQQLSSASQTQRFFVVSDTLGTVAATLNNRIPAGTLVYTADSSIQYRLISDIVFNDSDTSVYGNIEAVSGGSTSNVGANTLTYHNLGITNLLTTNMSDVTTGTDTQTDEEYRYILSKAVTAAEAANETAVRLAALSISGVSDVLIVPYIEGVGTFGIIVIGTTPIVSTDVLNNVTIAVNTVKALGEYTTISHPRYIGFEINAHLIFRSTTDAVTKQSVTDLVQSNIYNYIDNIPMGNEFVRNEVIQVTMDTSTEILDIDTDPNSSTCLSIHYWSPTTIEIDSNDNEVSNRIRTLLTSNYIGFFDDKPITEQNVQGN
jgi:hypothetical protein